MALDIHEIYQDLHRNPELSFQEERTSDFIARTLGDLGYVVHTGIGRTGVVGFLENGEGPTVLLRADMDGLPLDEQTGLPYASTARGIDPEGRDVPVMHACGHDVHVTCLLGAAEELMETRSEWAGSLILVFQPAEELGEGARAMVDDGLYEKVPAPDVVLGQHVAPLPAGMIGLRPGDAMAASDSLNIKLFGEGGHGSRPEAAVDPVLLAAAVVMRLQGVVSREVASTDAAVVTVGQIHSGTKNNIIPEFATLGLSIRTYDPVVRERVLAAIERIARAEAQASGSPREPEFIYDTSLPLTHNDPDASARTATALRAVVGEMGVMDPGPIAGSEDVSHLATAAGCPLVFWFLGGAEPSLIERIRETGKLPDDIPSNHSPFYAPVMDPTLHLGVDAMVAAAREWLG
ncbi:MAG: amidohydrolase [Acidimicrobiales bacterium]|jgi:amidohydrolase|nr:amidohydrolase [Acidimicrobiales bacterium]